MRALVQRVRNAKVTIDGQVVGSCGKGSLVLLGIGRGDDDVCAKRLWDKIFRLRIFGDDSGKTNLSLADVDGEVMVVSQFTLYADCKRGNRPSFTAAASPDEANRLYELFCDLAERDARHVGRGVFGADMQVELLNDGPFTIWLDTEELGMGKAR